VIQSTSRKTDQAGGPAILLGFGGITEIMKGVIGRGSGL
jgi:hypothetical protein